MAHYGCPDRVVVCTYLNTGELTVGKLFVAIFQGTVANSTTAFPDVDIKAVVDCFRFLQGLGVTMHANFASSRLAISIVEAAGCRHESCPSSKTQVHDWS
jgi:hypothetical protein